MSDQWSRRGEFVNLVLAIACGWGNVAFEETEFDGVAGEQFDRAVDPKLCEEEQCNDYIRIALQLGVPVEGLEADGEFGPKWAEVVALAKEEDSPFPVVQGLSHH